MLDRIGDKTLATEMRHRITIQRQLSTTDGDGGFGVTWSDLSSCFAAIYPKQARQVFKFRTIDVDATHQIRIRRQIEIEELDRIVFKNRVFEVLSIERAIWSDYYKNINCKEVR